MRPPLVALVLVGLLLVSVSLPGAQTPKPDRVVFVPPASFAGNPAVADLDKLRQAVAAEAAPAIPKTPPTTVLRGGAAPADLINCWMTPLVSGVPVSTIPSVPPDYYSHSIHQPVNYWSAVGVRSAPGEDWDLELYAGTGQSPPPCLDTLVAYSNRPVGVDFVLGDFNHVGAADDYVHAFRYSGTRNGLLEWDDGADIVVANGGHVQRTTGPDDVLEAWDVLLEAGKTYLISLWSDGGAQVSLALFRNPGSGPWYAARAGSIYEIPGTGGFYFDCTVTDWYSLVAVNDDGGTGSYSFTVGYCPEPTPLTSGVSATTPLAYSYWSFDQSRRAWSVLGVRGFNPLAEWSLNVYGLPGGSEWPMCFGDHRGTSWWNPGRVALVGGDFNPGWTTPGLWYVGAFRGTESLDGRVEWEEGGNVLAPMSWVSGGVDASDVVEVWDLPLVAEVDYLLEMDRAGANLRALVLSSRWGQWPPRNHALIDTAGPCAGFVPTVDGDHALVLANDDGGTGTYTLRAGEQFLDLAPPAFASPVFGTGIAAADFDDDADLDLYMVVSGGPDRLFRNNGGVLTEVLPSPFPHPGHDLDAVWGDYDNDGDLDVYAVNNIGNNVLYRNDGGTFVDATLPPLDDPYSSQRASWADYDRDGLIDLFVAEGGSDRLYHNEGGGLFTVATPAALHFMIGRDGAWGDYDDDGDQDLYVVSSDDYASQLLRNDDGTFQDATPAILDRGFEGYASATWLDVDNDEDLDLLVVQNGSDHLFRNDGGGAFTDIAAGPLADPVASHGVAVADYDNDGDLDIFLPDAGSGPARLLRNHGNGTFVQALGPAAAGGGPYWGACAGDFMRIGVIDFAMAAWSWNTPGTNRLLHNRTGDAPCTPNNWLKIRLQGVRSNRFGVGARIRLHAGGVTQIREVVGESGNCSYLSHFGLGEASVADWIEVRWPSGAVQQVTNVPASGTHVIVEDTSGFIGVGETEAAPEVLALHPARPNPLRAETTFRYDLPEPSPIRIEVYDLAGRRTRVLIDRDSHVAGRFETTWDGRDARGDRVPAGIYFLRLTAGARSHAVKIAVLR